MQITALPVSIRGMIGWGRVEFNQAMLMEMLTVRAHEAFPILALCK